MAHIGDDKVRSDDELKRIFDSIDADGSGEVSLKEFMAWFSYDYVLKQDERMWGFIKTLDKNNDGKITLDEIEDALKKKNVTNLLNDIRKLHYSKITLNFFISLCAWKMEFISKKISRGIFSED